MTLVDHGTAVISSDLLAAYPDDGTPLSGVVTSALRREISALSKNMRDGETVALALPNGPAWVTAYLAVLAAGAHPLLVPADSPEAETARLLALRGGGRRLDERLVVTGDPGERRPGPSVTLIPTSGSTGAPKLVERSTSSLVQEGLRYRDGVGVSSADSVLLPVPLSHAYGLGWLYGALLAGSTVTVCPPTALGRVASELAHATVVVLTPTTARLLTLRGARKAVVAPRLRLAMVGAGPVDDELERPFRAVFGTGLARDYGSTELGSIFAGPPGLPARCVGLPLPGVEYRLLDDEGTVLDGPSGAEKGPGLLQVRTPDTGAGWHDTGDLARTLPGGSLQILGRRGRAIRRGGRWVSPLEIESVLKAQPGIRDAHVFARSRDHEGEDRIVAHVVGEAGDSAGAELREHLTAQLAPYKVPDEIEFREQLRRGPSGKVVAPPTYRLTARAAAVARAYKASELLFALHEVGALESLAAGADPDALASDLGLDPEALDWLLRTGAGLGLLTTGGDEERAAPAPAELAAFVRLEKHLSRTLVSREELAAVARSGRRFDTLDDLGPLPELYAAAMHGPSAAGRTAMGLRLLRPARGGRVVEVSAGPGRYLERLLRTDDSATGHLVQLGRLSGPLAPGVAGKASTGPLPADGVADAVVVANGIHGPGAGADLDALLATLRPGGRLLVDDVFLPESGEDAGLGLDWATHGGTAWPTVADLLAGLTGAGAEIVKHLPLGSSPCHLIIATKEPVS